MAGCACHRGMDSDGTCVIVATPFEGPEDAASILLSEVSLITSQFLPPTRLLLTLSPVVLESRVLPATLFKDRLLCGKYNNKSNNILHLAQ
jgi:hypothetical protein